MMCLFRQGGGGEAEATLSDAQLSRFSGPDVLCKLRHPGGLPTVVSTGIKGKTGWWMVGFIIVPDFLRFLQRDRFSTFATDFLLKKNQGRDAFCFLVLTKKEKCENISSVWNSQIFLCTFICCQDDGDVNSC